MKRIKRFGIYQTAKVAAVIYFLIAAIFVIPFSIFGSFFNDSFNSFPVFGGMFFIFVPFIYGFMAFVMVAIGCAVYNLIAKWTGGIEVEIETVNGRKDTLEETVN